MERTKYASDGSAPDSLRRSYSSCCARKETHDATHADASGACPCTHTSHANAQRARLAEDVAVKLGVIQIAVPPLVARQQLAVAAVVHTKSARVSHSSRRI
jgi:hypothetical protein